MAAAPPFGPGPFLIAGPCVLEDDRLNLAVGEHLARLAQRHAITVTYNYVPFINLPFTPTLTTQAAGRIVN